MKPMDSIDVSNRKPRRFKGTPAQKVRSWITVAFVAYTLVSAGVYMFSPINRDIWTVFELLGQARKHELEETTPEERFQKNAMFRSYAAILKKQSEPDARKEIESKTGQ